MAGRAATEPGTPSSCKFNDRIVAAFGEDGKTGRVGALESKVKKLEETQYRLVLLTCTGSVAGGGIIAGIIKLFSN